VSFLFFIGNSPQSGTKARNGSQASNKEQLREETLMAVTDLKKNKKRVKTFFSK
jgi:hypothetical protein